jgi:hypothetical protein
LGRDEAPDLVDGLETVVHEVREAVDEVPEVVGRPPRGHS